MRIHVLLLAAVIGLAACAHSDKKQAGGSSAGTVSSGASTGTPSKSASGSKTATKPAGTDYAVGRIVAGDGGAVPASFVSALRTHLANALAQGDRLAKTGETSRAVDITLSDFRLRDGAAPALDAHVTSAVVVKDSRGRVIGESKFSSSNILAPDSSEALAKLNADEIARFLLGAPLKN